MERIKMNKPNFYIVDVFAEAKYAGNQLAVIAGAGGLSGDEMQEIAKEMNYSETTFILSDKPRDGGYDVRIFTPDVEVPFAGHPTLGTAFVIQQEIIGQQVETINLNLEIGQIPVTFNYDGQQTGVLWLKPKEPVFGDVFDAGQVQRFLTIEKEDIDQRFPIQQVSAGIPFIFVPLKTLDAVKRAGIIMDKLLDWVDARGTSREVFVFCPEAYHKDNNINARMFAECVGVPEDPATGSANCCLAAYLVKHRYFESGKIDVRVEQGYEIGRPSLLYLQAEEIDGKIDVAVGGKVVMIAKCQLV
jgi:trans-2,3-dihydro-3-hydroxyanthranilate isomerase